MALIKRIVVTGPTGFVGRPLSASLLRRGFGVREAVRQVVGDRQLGQTDPALECVVVGDIHGETDWSDVLDGADVVIHLAGRAHVMRERYADPLSEYRRVNVAGTINLARQAVSAGARRFVCVSSIKVNGERTTDRPFTPADVPQPSDPYGVSKWEAEQSLQQLARETGLDVVVVRPPLVYGPDVRGNFLSLLRWIKRGFPLPLSRVENRRSLVALDNLVDLLVRCVDHPRAAGQTFLISDGEDLSTPDLIRRLAAAMGRPDRLFGVPVNVLKRFAYAVGTGAAFDRLCGSLQVDASHTRRILDWSPPVSVDAALQDTVRWYLASHGRRGWGAW